MISDFIYGILGIFGISKPDNDAEATHDTPSRMEEALSPQAGSMGMGFDDEDDRNDEDAMDDLDFML